MKKKAGLKTSGIKAEPIKTKQLQLNKEEILELELRQTQITNLQMQMENINNSAKNVILDFCKRVNEKPENLVLDPLGRYVIDQQGKVSFKEV